MMKIGERRQKCGNPQRTVWKQWFHEILIIPPRRITNKQSQPDNTTLYTDACESLVEFDAQIVVQEKLGDAIEQKRGVSLLQQLTVAQCNNKDGQ